MYKKTVRLHQPKTSIRCRVNSEKANELVLYNICLIEYMSNRSRKKIKVNSLKFTLSFSFFSLSEIFRLNQVIGSVHYQLFQAILKLNNNGLWFLPHLLHSCSALIPVEVFHSFD